MKKLTAIAAIPLFAGFLMAQSQSGSQTQTESRTTETRTTTQNDQSNNTWTGTLVDASCRTSQTAHRESSETTHPDENTTRTTTSKSDSYTTECPITTSTTNFGLVTADGQYVSFDQPSNTRVIEVVKKNKNWNRYMSEHKPVKVTVVGNRHGDAVVVESIK
jgi:cytoskeletal protein RodZ